METQWVGLGNAAIAEADHEGRNRPPEPDLRHDAEHGQRTHLKFQRNASKRGGRGAHRPVLVKVRLDYKEPVELRRVDACVVGARAMGRNPR